MRIFPDSLAALVFPESTPEEWFDSLTTVLLSDILVDDSQRKVSFCFPESAVTVALCRSGYATHVEVSIEPDKIAVLFGDSIIDFNDVFIDEPCQAPVGDGVWDKEKQAWIMNDINSAIAAAVIQDGLDKFGNSMEISFPWSSLLGQEEVQLFLSLLPKETPFLDGLGEIPQYEIDMVVDRWGKLNGRSYSDNAIYAVVAASLHKGIVPPFLWGANVRIVCS